MQCPLSGVPGSSLLQPSPPGCGVAAEAASVHDAAGRLRRALLVGFCVSVQCGPCDTVKGVFVLLVPSYAGSSSELDRILPDSLSFNPHT